MRIAVTGANGLVGSRLCRGLAERAHEVCGLSRGDRRGTGTFEYVPCDVTDASAVASALTRLRPEVIINTASMTDVDGCERDPKGAWAANASAAAHVATTCRDLGTHLVHVSTDYIFDGDEGPYSEDDVPNPRGVYAQSKLGGELAVRSLAGSWAIARTAVVYGWPPAGRPNFGSWLVSALGNRQPVKLFEDQFVSPSLADSVAAMLAELAERKLTGIWNTAGADVVDRVTYGRAVCKLFGLDEALITPSKLKDVKLASPRPLRSGLRPDKASAELAEKPLALPVALARFHAAWRDAR
jgi:dTDP-4-dehydrorhamnose reductase